MKVIVKPKRIEVCEAIEVSKDMVGKVLIDTPLLTQMILEIDEQIVIREHSIDNTDQYNSSSDIDVFLEEGDLLIKVEKGYTKALANFTILDKPLEKAVDKINKIK
jgi:hypothetical protein